MSNKKQIKSAFNTLMNKSVKFNFEAIENKLQPQNFNLATSKSVPHKSLKFVYTAASFVLLIAITGIAASLSLSHRNSYIAFSNTAKANSRSSIASKQLGVIESNKSANTAQKFTNAAASLAIAPVGPQYLNYNHRIYIGIPNFTKNRMDSKKNLIGYIYFEGHGIPVYSLKNESTKNSICLWNTNKSSSISKISYFKYHYLCDDSFAVRGRTYHITSPLDVDMSSKSSSCNAGNKNTSNGYKINWNISDSIELQAVKAIFGKKIGKTASGETVYAIDEISPSEAVSVNSGDNWFTISKADGYSGKTVDDVMKDKGIGIEDLN